MELTFQDRLQFLLDHHLCHPIRYRWYSQGTISPVRLRNIYASDRLRMITARRHPIPDIVEIIPKIGLKLRDGLLINPGPSLIRLYPLPRLPNLALESLETALRSALKSSLSVASSRLAAWFTPFALLPLQKHHHYYEVIRPCGMPWYSMSHRYGPLDTLPLHHPDRFPRSMQGPKP